MTVLSLKSLRHFRPPGLESALKWIFSGPKRPSLKKKKTNEELEALIEALRVRTASGALILTLDAGSNLKQQDIYVLFEEIHHWEFTNKLGSVFIIFTFFWGADVIS